MKKYVLLLCMIGFFSIPCLAKDKNPLASYDEKEADKWLEDCKLRVVFVIKKDGKECVLIRLAPGQFRGAQARAKVKRVGVVRVALRPRQIHLLKKIIGEEYRWSKVILRIPCKKLNAGKGLKNRYVIRPKAAFVKDPKDKNIFEMDGDLEESDQELAPPEEEGDDEGDDDDEGGDDEGDDDDEGGDDE